MCTHRTYVVGTEDKLMRKKHILVRFYVVARTDCERSTQNATLKIEVNSASHGTELIILGSKLHCGSSKLKELV